ncbi:flagella synthesis protein FlgN [Alcaligenes endophyticus]|uniref:Flagellar protein FlgN n=1 Tax=Alcaligenes endophyticus TaxID=1929088 RepID=A0ABT8ELC5_9BURK|nr:flagellar protein FlgN [Alcaligenes endophyticus]MCX5590545.1 flagellar protein FlgN [Alcaligenes endophyticus]MDN4122091.1 flagellar protein FlgN [Alcaligenes endophyticus]
MPPHSDLAHCLERHIATLHEFLHVAQTEHELLLRSFEPEALASITQQKNLLLADIIKLDHERHQYLQSFELGPDAEGLQALALQVPELADAVQTLISLSATARQQNENNGALIHIFLNNNQQALDTLAAITGKNSFYTAHGRPTSAALGNTSFKA